MKKIIIALLCFISLSASAQDSIKLSIPDSSKLTLIKVYNDTKAGLAGLAGALKTPVTHVYEILVKQQIVESITYLTVFLGFLIISLIMLSIFNKSYKKIQNPDDPWYNDNLDDHPLTLLSLLLAIFLVLITTIIFCVNIGDIVNGFVNPEYGAIKKIVSFVK